MCYSFSTSPNCLSNSCANPMLASWLKEYLLGQCFLSVSSVSYLLLKKFALLIATDYQKESLFIFDFELDLLKIQALMIEPFKLFENLYFIFAFDLMLDYLKQICLDRNSNNGQHQTFHLEQLVCFFKKSICRRFVLGLLKNYLKVLLIQNENFVWLVVDYKFKPHFDLKSNQATHIKFILMHFIN